MSVTKLELRNEKRIEFVAKLKLVNDRGEGWKRG